VSHDGKVCDRRRTHLRGVSGREGETKKKTRKKGRFHSEGFTAFKPFLSEQKGGGKGGTIQRESRKKRGRPATGPRKWEADRI